MSEQEHVYEARIFGPDSDGDYRADITVDGEHGTVKIRASRIEVEQAARAWVKWHRDGFEVDEVISL